MPFDNGQNSIMKEIGSYSVNITKEVSVSIETGIIKSTCQYPNLGLVISSNVAPVISDRVRVNAILDLIRKIVDCEKLPF